MYGGNPVQAVTIKRGVPPNSRAWGVRRYRPSERLDSGAVAGLRLVASRKGLKRGASADRQSTESRRGGLVALRCLDRGERDLPDALDERATEAEQARLRDLASRGDHDTQVDTGALAVGSDLDGVAVPRGHLVAGLAGHVLHHVGDLSCFEEKAVAD